MYAAETAIHNENTVPAAESNSLDSPVIPAEQTSNANENAGAAASADNQSGGSSEIKKNQDQSAVTSVSQNQNVTGDPSAAQNQNANVIVCQQQTAVLTASCQDNGGSTAEAGVQKQTANIDAAQTQSVLTSQTGTASQEQDTGVTSNQSQDILLPSGGKQSQSQGTDISTSQLESANLNSQTDILQVQQAGIFNSQSQQLDQENSKLSQETAIKALQLQHFITFGYALAEQNQTAEAKSNMNNGENCSVAAGVQVATSNSIEVIKNTSVNAVKLVQKILFNNQIVESSQDYTFDGNTSYSVEQKIQKQYEWGFVEVTNSTFVHFNEKFQSVEATLTSFINLVFNKKQSCNGDSDKPKPDDGHPPDTNNGGNSSGSNDSGDPSKNPITPNPGQTEKTSDENSIPAVPVNETKLEQTVSSDSGNVWTAPSKSDANQTAANVNTLPDTGSNNYNILIVGLLLLVSGTGSLFLIKKLSVNKKN